MAVFESSGNFGFTYLMNPMDASCSSGFDLLGITLIQTPMKVEPVDRKSRARELRCSLATPPVRMLQQPCGNVRSGFGVKIPSGDKCFWTHLARCRVSLRKQTLPPVILRREVPKESCSPFRTEPQVLPI